MDTSCVKQSDAPKYVVHVLGGDVSKKTDSNNKYYDTSKYVVHVLGGAV